MSLSSPQIPGYRDLRPLGAGSFADVYVATDESVARQVAIKVLRARTPNVAQLERFRRERETLAALNHPHVLRVHSAGSVGGRPYVVTELLSGQTLADVLGEARESEVPDQDTALELLHQAALGVAALHSAGLVHRDLKPDNLLIDEHGKAKVADLGLVGGAELSSLTAAGAMLGTPAYAAPEVCRTVSTRDPSCDVYSLGAILYEVLTGEIPHDSPTLAVLIVRRLDTPNPDPRQVRAEISRELAAVCKRAMALEPGDRYANGQEFADALAEARAGAAVERVSGGLVLLGSLATLAVALPLLALAFPDPAPLPPEANPQVSTTPPPPQAPALTAEEVLAMLGAREPNAIGAARAWITEHPEHEAADRVREAAYAYQLLGDPLRAHTRPLAHPTHRPLARPLGGGALLWAEFCPPWCQRRHPARGSLSRIEADGSTSQLDWQGSYVTAVAADDELWAAETSAEHSYLFSYSGGRPTPIFRLPGRCHSILRYGRGVFCGLGDGSVAYLDAESGAEIWTRQVHSHPVRGLFLYPEETLVSFAMEERVPIELSARATGARRAWPSELPPLGAIRWALHVPQTNELVLCLSPSNMVHGVRPDGQTRSFSGEALAGTRRPEAIGMLSPDGITSRAALRVGHLLLNVGSRQLGRQLRSELRLFSLRHGREFCVRGVEKPAYYSATYLAKSKLLLVEAKQGASGVIEVFDLNLGPLSLDTSSPSAREKTRRD